MAEFQELIFFDPAGESELFRANSNPFTGHRIFLAVIIAKLQMFFEVFFRVVQVGLNLGGQHAVFYRIQFARVVMNSSQPITEESDSMGA